MNKNIFEDKIKIFNADFYFLLTQYTGMNGIFLSAW
jgi:hypothetical protein